jgi:hypothetical protein
MPFSSSPHLAKGSKNDVGGTAEALSADDTILLNGLTLKANLLNTAGHAVWVGDADTVTPGTTEATDGFPLYPGESISLPIDQASRVFVVSSTTAQKVHWVGN